VAGKLNYILHLYPFQFFIMKIFIASVLLLFVLAPSLRAQYFYKDIITVKQAARDIADYKQSAKRQIKIKSFEPNGIESENFFCEKKINKNYTKASLYTRTDISSQALLESYYNADGLLIRSYDSSEFVVSNTYYEYNSNQQLTQTTFLSKSSDDDFLNSIKEVHQYEYNAENKLESMMRIKNEIDTFLVAFSLDEHQNVAVEKDNKTSTTYYYYYDEQNRLTDVVHAVDYKEKLVADYVFEYNTAGQIVQMTNTEPGTNNFNVWKYVYENGLRTTERVFTKDGDLMGKIIYEYQ